MLLVQSREHCCYYRMKSLNSLWHLISTLCTALTKLAPSHTTVSYLFQETFILCKLLKSFWNELQVQAGAFGRGAEVFVFPVRQKVDVSALISCGTIKNVEVKGHCPPLIQETLIQTGSGAKSAVDFSVRERKDNQANKTTELVHTHAGGLKKI